MLLPWKDYLHLANSYKTHDGYGMQLDAQRMWDDLEEQFDAYPDGAGNIQFDTEAGASMFILKYSKIP